MAELIDFNGKSYISFDSVIDILDCIKRYPQKIDDIIRMIASCVRRCDSEQKRSTRQINGEIIQS